MDPALVAGCLWVLGAAATAALPMRLQLAPGLGLLLAAPVVMAWIGWAVGWWAGLLMLAAVASMFRRPLGALWRRATAGERGA